MCNERLFFYSRSSTVLAPIVSLNSVIFCTKSMNTFVGSVCRSSWTRAPGWPQTIMAFAKCSTLLSMSPLAIHCSPRQISCRKNCCTASCSTAFGICRVCDFLVRLRPGKTTKEINYDGIGAKVTTDSRAYRHEFSSSGRNKCSSPTAGCQRRPP